jgi:hypothetical protein
MFFHRKMTRVAKQSLLYYHSASVIGAEQPWEKIHAIGPIAGSLLGVF